MPGTEQWTLEATQRQRAFDAEAGRQRFSAVAEAQLLELLCRRWFTAGWKAGTAWALDREAEAEVRDAETVAPEDLAARFRGTDTCVGRFGRQFGQEPTAPKGAQAHDGRQSDQATVADDLGQVAHMEGS